MRVKMSILIWGISATVGFFTAGTTEATSRTVLAELFTSTT